VNSPISLRLNLVRAARQSAAALTLSLRNDCPDEPRRALHWPRSDHSLGRPCGLVNDPGQGVRRSTPYLKTFRKAVMTTAFVKSMKKAPTIGTTR
jgi:hypothetical protein